LSIRSRDGTSNGIIKFEGNNGTATTEYARIDSSGNVGIGTTNPADGLEISHINPKIRLRESDVTNGFADILYNSTRLRIRSRNGNASGGIAFEGSDGSTVTEYARFNNAGNLGIGTTNPNEPLHIKNSDPKVKLEYADGTDQVATIFHSGSVLTLQSRDGTSHGIIKFTGYNGTSGLEYARFNSSGNLGIGTTSPSEKLDVAGQVRIEENGLSKQHLKLVDSNATSKFGQIGFDNGILRIDSLDTSGNGVIQFYRSTTGYGAESARFDSSGNFLVGMSSYSTTSAGHYITPAGAIFSQADDARVATFSRFTSDGEIVRFRKNSTTVGNISVTGSATTYNTSSDARLKDDISDFDGLGIVEQLNPRKFAWKSDGQEDIGLYAQEVKELVPNAVSQNEDGYYQMDYSKLVTPLIKAIQEQQEQIEELKQQLEELKN